MVSPQPDFRTPDFRTVVANFEQLTQEWAAKTERLSAALAASGGEFECEEFTLRTAGPTQITELVFTDQAAQSSPVQLRESVLTSYAELGVASNGAQARAVATILDAPEVAEGMGRSLPPEFRDRVEVAEVTVEDSSAGDESAGVPYTETATPEQVLAWAEESADPDVIISADPVELMSDVEGWSPAYLGRFDPNTAQYDYDRQIESISAAAKDLAPALERVRGQASSTLLEVEVAGSGRLVDLKFRPGFRNASGDALSQDFAELYAKATHEATEQTMQLIEDAGLGGAEDPTESMMRRLDEAVDGLMHDLESRP